MIRALTLHKSYRLNERAVRRIASDVLGMIRKTRSADLEFIFLDDKAIRKFNKRYTSRDRSTDVLSFRIDRREFGRRKFLGEILVSLDAARKNSKVYGTGFAEETVLYMIHGILHLFGYDDGNARDRGEMSKEQYRILDKLCSCRNLSGVLTPR
ncbi:MAG: rRNA maturation RNase YbeY [Candidatus Omnitrophota bacterium]